MAPSIPPDDIAYLSALVREHDRPRYYASLFAPAAIRNDLIALYGFATEVARVPELVSEPQLGEIRLRWWGDSLAAASAPGGEGHTPALRAAAALISTYRLPVSPFEALIAARSADLHSDPPAHAADLEGRLGATESVLFQMAAIIAGAKGPEAADAAGHAGVAYGLARRLACVSRERARGRTVLPADLLAGANLSPAELFAPALHPGLPNAVAAAAGIARSHLTKAEQRIASLNRPLRLAFLPLAVVAPLLRRIESAGAEIGAREVRLSDLESLIRIGIARLR